MRESRKWAMNTINIWSVILFYCYLLLSFIFIIVILLVMLTLYYNLFIGKFIIYLVGHL